MRHLDIVTLGFVALAAVGIWKTVPGMRLQKAASVAVLAWLVCTILAVWWRQ
jgi:hypothetical protein